MKKIDPVNYVKKLSWEELIEEIKHQEKMYMSSDNEELKRGLEILYFELELRKRLKEDFLSIVGS